MFYFTLGIKGTKGVDVLHTNSDNKRVNENCVSKIL